MVEMDYIFEADTLRDECQGQDVLSDYTLPEREMPVRLHVSGVEVFGQTEEDYQRWMDDLNSNNLTIQVPSSAWSLLSVLSIAVSVDGAFQRLREEGHADIDSLDCVIRLVQQDDNVSVHIRPDRAGQASYADMYAAFSSLAKRVHDDFLSVCPTLRDHVTLGSWFRGEGALAISEKSREVIYLPSASYRASHD